MTEEDNNHNKNRKWNKRKKKRKMNGLKKMLRGGSELLQLALILSLLRIDPDSLLLPFNNNNSNDLSLLSTGDIFESVLTQFLAAPPRNINHRGQDHDLNIHPKNFDNAVERILNMQQLIVQMNKFIL